MSELKPPLSKVYDPKLVEDHWYEVWEKAGYLKPGSSGSPFTLVIPPPNVTGSLHMGHALNSTLQDITLRYRKMKGDSALWVPGTDHGGIATQNVMEKILKSEGTSRHDLGREKFLERMWKWRNETGDIILGQLRRLGAALDWSRTRFTMDEVCSRAVRAAFVELYKKKLLYRGKRLVNWCPRCHTALADIEVEHKESNSHLWHIKYPLVDRRNKSRPSKKKKSADNAFTKGAITVATTRPETMLGDTAVAVHPKDKRYKDVVGLHVKLPITGRIIPIVADEAVDKSFGSGAVKVTPSHDRADFEIAGRHNLPHIPVIGFDGKMTKAAGHGLDGEPFMGMDRFKARKKVVEELEKAGAIEKVEDYKVALSVCYRCDDVIEPLESEQWFLSVKKMAARAREATKKGRVKIIPKSWENPYQLWLRNLHDWCVSRQIWWGHRIPVWYCVEEKKGEVKKTSCSPIVSMEDPARCPSCKKTKLEQDPDVLDTWFSSALWPFSVFGWPDKTADLKRFFPTQLLVTGHEILYLWVARMVMFALEFLDDVPYSTILIHGIVRDKGGRKMSKSLGNVIDPLDLIKDYGADAVRFSLARSAAPGRDMQIAKDNFIAARNFSNKIWNATRFALMHLSGLKHLEPLEKHSAHMELADRWILHRYNQVVEETTDAMESLNLDAASRGLYDFFWSDFCDWYLEMVKPRLDPSRVSESGISKESGEAARQVLGTVLEGSMRLLHPFIPFITEEIWQKLPKPMDNKATHLMVSFWVKANDQFKNEKAFKEMGRLQEVVTKIRNIRSEMGIPPAQPIELWVNSKKPEKVNIFHEHGSLLQFLNTRVNKMIIENNLKRPESSATAVVEGADLYVPLEGLIDFAKEKARLEKEYATKKLDADRLGKKMSNQDFLTHAPKEEVEKATARLKESKERLKSLQSHIATLSH